MKGRKITVKLIGEFIDGTIISNSYDLAVNDTAVLSALRSKGAVLDGVSPKGSLAGADKFLENICDMISELRQGEFLRECIYYTDPEYWGDAGPHKGMMSGLLLDSDPDPYAIIADGIEVYLVRTKDIMHNNKDHRSYLDVPSRLETKNAGVFTIRYRPLKSELLTILVGMKDWVSTKKPDTIMTMCSSR